MWITAYENCNISETGQLRYRTNVTIDDQQKSHTRFRLVRKSTILDDLGRVIMHYLSRHMRFS